MAFQFPAPALITKYASPTATNIRAAAVSSGPKRSFSKYATIAMAIRPVMVCTTVR